MRQIGAILLDSVDLVQARDCQVHLTHALRSLSPLDNRKIHAFFTRAVSTSDLFDTPFGIDHFGLMLRKQACYLFENSIQELIFRDSFDDLPFAEDHTLALTTS